VPIVAGATAFCFIQSRHSLQEDGQAIAGLLGKQKAEAVAEAASTMAERHPSDYYSHLVAAQAYAAERPLHADKLVGFANRAMYLNPALPLPHRLAALALRATGHMAQARIEYKLAYELRDGTVVPEVTRVFQKPEELVDAMPDTPEALGALADQLIAEHRLDDADAVTRTSIAKHGEKAVALQRLASIAARRGLPADQFKVGVRLSEIAPSETIGLQVRVEALLTLNDPVGALSLLEGEGLKKFPTDSGVLLSLARLRLQRGDTKGCREALKRLPVSMDVNVRLAALSLESVAAEHDGQGTKALSLMRQAVTMRPEDPGWRWQYALLLERLGRDDQAVREAEAAAQKSAGLREQVEKLKERAATRKKEMEEMRRWKDVAKDSPDAPHP
jgi:tetratricopeptide (TPR) repeat protein